MKLAIMQPYLFPYLGYFQLMRAVDAFVVYDDVNFIKGGWINRNYILSNGDKQLITLPLQGASPNKMINQVDIGTQHKILQSIRQNYNKAPYFECVFPMLEKILRYNHRNLAEFLDHQLRVLCGYLNLSPEWHISSALKKNIELRSQDKVIAICRELGATHYINTAGGKALYDAQSFASHGLKLSFIQSRPISYSQFGKEFLPNLSIVDVMMFNDREQCAQLLQEYDLV
ncbi:MULTISPECIES: WbqC family protein [Pseudomonas]|uniref:WbqC family protein n=1 Tax=Pseudomonas TaxID=286 RepID=UPI001CCC8C49|nr:MULTISPECIES: WbqC family protein [Pseudomonas]MBP5945325.1 WbqC family protein [Pseudomonas sp. P9(2020)]MBP5955745.1 WbqC family protein [Pseudomonas anatoliensis]MBZ9563801.1 WbqC family protein [Pseudomonas sp. P116]